MTNKEIAAQVADSMVGAANSMYPTIYDGIIEALRMKDKQILTLCHRCEERIEEMDKTCVWLHIDNKHCWED